MMNPTMTISDKTVTFTVYRLNIIVVVTCLWTIPSHHRDCGRKICGAATPLPECVPGCVFCGVVVEFPSAVDEHRTTVHSSSAIIFELCYWFYEGCYPRCWRSDGQFLDDVRCWISQRLCWTRFRGSNTWPHKNLWH